MSGTAHGDERDGAQGGTGAVADVHPWLDE